MTNDMKVNKLKLGVEVFGIDLNDEIPPTTLDAIQALVLEHRVVVFRDQHNLTGQRHVELTDLFGGVDTSVVGDDPLFRHPKCPHPNIYRISNDPDEGCTNAGRSGWHIDGSVFAKPFAYTTLHVISAPTHGATEFVGFRELLTSVGPETRSRWKRLWTLPDKVNGVIQPLVYDHPDTREPVMCFHLGFTKSFIWDYGTANERVTDEEETKQLKQEIVDEITKNGSELVYAHPWKTGDFGMSDNLAVAHFASSDSQRPRSEVGLRVLHRTTVQGHAVPQR